MNNQDEQHTLDCFRAYQKTRGQNYQKRFSENALITQDDQTAQDTSWESVETLYREFQRGRDPYRAAVFMNVLNAAKLYLEERKAVPAVSPAVSLAQPGRTPAWVSKLYFAITAVFSVSHTARLAFAAMLAAVAIVPLIWWPIGSDTRAFSDAGRALTAENAVIAQIIQPASSPVFSFSSTAASNQIAFRYGVASVDLPLLAASQNIYALRSLSLDIKANLATIDSKSLRNHLTQFEAALQNSSHAEFLSASRVLATALRDHYQSHKLQPVFELGQRVEIMALATRLKDQKRLSWEKLLRLSAATALEAEKHIMTLDGAPRLLQLVLLSSVKQPHTQSELDKLYSELIKLKAVMM